MGHVLVAVVGSSALHDSFAVFLQPYFLAHHLRSAYCEI